jgi:MerR family redox-sensitive transcriptional activator SoxR
MISLIVMERMMSIGDLSCRSGVATSTLRFYEDRGLLSAERTSAGHRRYPYAALRRVAFIVFAQRVGLTLEEIRVELDKLPADRAPAREDWSRLAQGWGARIDQRIAELERLKRGLTDCIGCGCLSLDRCAMINPEDRVAANGPGPRFWIGDERPEPFRQAEHSKQEPWCRNPE